MKHIQLTVLIVVFGLLILVQTSFAQTVDERIKRVTDLLNKNDNEGAMPDIEEILKAQPDNATALASRGIVNYRKHNYEPAIADFTKAIALNPNASNYYHNRGLAYSYNPNHDYKSAIADFSRAIELLPNFGFAYYERGWANINLKNWSAAESDFTQAIKCGVSDKYIYLNRGAARYNLGSYGQAAADYRKSLEIDSNYDLAKTKIAEVTAWLKQTPAQIQIDKLIVGELPKSLLANESPQMIDKYSRIVKLINANDLDAATKILEEAVYKNTPNMAVGYYLAGIVYYKRSDFDGAYSLETKAIELNPNIAESYYIRGLAVRYDPNTWNIEVLRGTIKDFAKAIELNPNYADALRERGFASYFFYTGDFYTPFNATYYYGSDISSAIRLNPKDGEALYFDAVTTYYPHFIWDKKYKKETNEMLVKMESKLTQAINSGTNRSSVYVLRGVANYFLNNRTQALADFQKALELNPNYTSASENIKIFNSNPKKEFYFYPGTPSFSPSSNPWAITMRELSKKLLQANSAANSSSTIEEGSTQEQICSHLVNWYSALGNSINLTAELISNSRSEREKAELVTGYQVVTKIRATAKSRLDAQQCSFH